MVPSLLSAMLLGSSPTVGQEAPEFTGTDTEGQTFSLSALVEKGPVIVAFFPKAFTPG
jgi:peroxiredoxin